MIRIAAAGIHHESNTFAATPADRSRFEAGGIQRGSEIVETYGESHSTMAGFLALNEVAGLVVEPLLYANVTPSGPLTDDILESLIDEILRDLRDGGPWDGVLLAQHGAAVADTEADVDGVVAQRVRGVVGPIPIGVAIDMHANVSERLARHSDVLVAYQTNPHVDPKIRARQCAEAIVGQIEGDVDPSLVAISIPIALHIACQDTGIGAMKDLLSFTREVERRESLVSASLIEGFPYADVPQMGMSVVAISNGDSERALRAATEIARAVWEARDELTTSLPTPPEALSAAVQASGPTLVLDVGDNIGGGSPGDSTVLLHEARQHGRLKLFQTLLAPEAAERCRDLGVGGRVDFELGGKIPGSPAPPFRVSGAVKGISNGRFEDPEPTHGGFRYFDQGFTALVETSEGFMIMVTSELVQNTSLNQMGHMGLDPASFEVIVAKGVNAPKAAYASVVSEMIYADTPGVTAANLNLLSYSRRPDPCFPFERFSWQPQDGLLLSDVG